MHGICYRPTELSLLKEFSKKSILNIFIILFEQDCPEAVVHASFHFEFHGILCWTLNGNDSWKTGYKNICLRKEFLKSKENHNAMLLSKIREQAKALPKPIVFPY